MSHVIHSARRLILATGRFIGEGFDDARMDTLFLPAPISWKDKMNNPNRTPGPKSIPANRLRQMAEDATVDANGEDEQLSGWLTMIENHLVLPFETEILGISVHVERVDLRDSGGFVAICRKGNRTQAIPLLDLPLPRPWPDGAEWIEAFRLWSSGR